MKKRTLGIVLAMVLALSFGMTAMAAPSKEVAGVVDEVTVEDAGDWNLIVTELDDEDKKLEEDIKTTDTMKEVLGDDYDADLSVLDVLDLEIYGDEEAVVYPIKARLAIPGITENSVVYVTQWNGEKWIKVPTVAGKGYITITVDAVNPIAIIADKATIKAVSPTTGMSTTTTAVGMAVAVAAIAAVVLAKKESAR